MPYCTNCGAQYDDGAKFCPTCGATTGEAAQSNAQQNAAYTTPTQPAQQPVQTDNSKTMAILAVVFPILFFLPIVTNPKTEFGTFWANQALLLLLLSVVASITAGIVIRHTHLGIPGSPLDNGPGERLQGRNEAPAAHRHHRHNKVSIG